LQQGDYLSVQFIHGRHSPWLEGLLVCLWVQFAIRCARCSLPEVPQYHMAGFQGCQHRKTIRCCRIWSNTDQSCRVSVHIKRNISNRNAHQGSWAVVSTVWSCRVLMGIGAFG